MLKSSLIREATASLGLDATGIVRASGVEARDLFAEWLASGYAGDMDYLSRYARERFDPGALLPGARSIIVTGLNYRPTEEDLARAASPYKVATYAWGEDYHRVLRRQLRRLRGRLRREEPGLKGRICVDTAPFMDKYWAQRAGLGWQGKHTNLVSRDHGSWLLLGSLVVTSEVDRYDDPHIDFCGTCTACLDACPTAAFPAPYQLDATRCISYWTIETKASAIPDDIASKMQDRVFGCDICLDVCPWNKFQKPRTHPDLARSDRVALIESGRVRELDAAEFESTFKTSALARPGPAGMARNLDALDR
jgi:epoxyqueuosine reductase